MDLALSEIRKTFLREADKAVEAFAEEARASYKAELCELCALLEKGAFPEAEAKAYILTALAWSVSDYHVAFAADLLRQALAHGEPGKFKNIAWFFTRSIKRLQNCEGAAYQPGRVELLGLLERLVEKQGVELVRSSRNYWSRLFVV
ncbi:MAG: hypothetical protein ACE5EM_01235 [Sphingomonadales bacterium]